MNEHISNFINGGIAGIISRTSTSPLERLKILQQNYPKIYNKHIFISFYKMYKYDGLYGLFKGNLTNCIRIFPQNAIQYSVFNISKNNLNTYIYNENILNFMGGAIGGIISYTSIYPLETVRSKLSVQNKKYNGIYDCLHKNIKNNGIYSLYRGGGVSALGFIPFQGSNFLSYYYFKNKYKNNKMNDQIKYFLFGSISGFISVSITYPFDIIKRKLQLTGEFGNPVYNSIQHCVEYTYKTHKIKGFYMGLTSCYLKIIPANGIYFMIIELLKDNN